MCGEEACFVMCCFWRTSPNKLRRIILLSFLNVELGWVVVFTFMLTCAIDATLPTSATSRDNSKSCESDLSIVSIDAKKGSSIHKNYIFYNLQDKLKSEKCTGSQHRGRALLERVLKKCSKQRGRFPGCFKWACLCLSNSHIIYVICCKSFCILVVQSLTPRLCSFSAVPCPVFFDAVPVLSSVTAK